MSIEVVPEMTEQRGEELFITVRSESIEELASPQAKRIAYAARGQYGFENAGIEAYGSITPEHVALRYAAVDDRIAGDPDPDGPKTASDPLPPELAQKTQWYQAFKLTRGL